VLGNQDKLTVCETTCVPDPDRPTDTGELALLVTVADPVTVPDPDGWKLTLIAALCPGASTWPDDIPLTPNPAPLTLIPESVTLPVPIFITVACKVAEFPTFTLPKLKLLGFIESSRVGALTVSTAALLVAVPAELLTVTVNCAPLSELTLAGVVYVDEVAPLIDPPFFIHWYVKGEVPEALTENDAVCPAITVRLAGWPVMVGDRAAAFTVSVAALLVTLPAELLTTTVNCSPLSVVAVTGVV
jgi:hypothetical protein